MVRPYDMTRHNAAEQRRINDMIGYWTPEPRRAPSWLTHPYADRDSCYGCGLEPEVMNPGQWILCRWCNDLRALMMARQ